MLAIIMLLIGIVSFVMGLDDFQDRMPSWIVWWAISFIAFLSFGLSINS